MEPHVIYLECIEDIRWMCALFDGDMCTDHMLAKERLIGLKARWKELSQREEARVAAGVIGEALERLPDPDTQPDRKWLSHLYDAEVEFERNLS